MHRPPTDKSWAVSPLTPAGSIMREQMFTKGDAAGMLRITCYAETTLVVAGFFPGRDIQNPGDTFKIEPDFTAEFPFKGEADAAFDAYQRVAINNGWAIDALPVEG